MQEFSALFYNFSINVKLCQIKKFINKTYATNLSYCAPSGAWQSFMANELPNPRNTVKEGFLKLSEFNSQRQSGKSRLSNKKKKKQCLFFTEQSKYYLSSSLRSRICSDHNKN